MAPPKFCESPVPPPGYPMYFYHVMPAPGDRYIRPSFQVAKLNDDVATCSVVSETDKEYYCHVVLPTFKEKREWHFTHCGRRVTLRGFFVKNRVKIPFKLEFGLPPNMSNETHHIHNEIAFSGGKIHFKFIQGAPRSSENRSVSDPSMCFLCGEPLAPGNDGNDHVTVEEKNEEQKSFTNMDLFKFALNHLQEEAKSMEKTLKVMNA